jgi:hypothetical protein
VSWFRRHLALPAEHGAWVFLLSPLVIGLFAGGRATLPSLYLVVAALCAFLVRHPVTLTIKALSGRRPRDVLPAALFWTTVYGLIGALHVLGLVLRGFGYVLWLALPALPVLVWHLWLISRRAERRQWLVEVAGAGVLALVAPAAMWVGLGRAAAEGWLLWVLLWSQSITAITYAYLRLAQRPLTAPPPPDQRLKMGAPALSLASAALAGVAVLGAVGAVPRPLWLPYALQAAVVAVGVARPAVGMKPKTIGWRQLALSAAFTALFVLTW